MNKYNRNIIIEKTVELGKSLADSNIINELRDAEVAFLNDEKAQFLLSKIKEHEKNGQHGVELKYLKEELFELDSYKRLLNAQKASKELMAEINSILNFYINGIEHKCDKDSCANCHRHCTK
ncbi:YlbF family regulator [Thermoanaerobacterium saccharolyticum]|uniref:YlbF family regulator n=1 Tax=Thermoanaerobacterium saccharolyticum TaxID=28896 RepID=UPI002FDABF56